MSQRRFYIAPSKNLAIGAGIVNGVNQGINNFMKMKQMKAEIELKREQMRAQAAYRNAQAQALKARYGDQDVDIGKVQTAIQMANHPGASPDEQQMGQKLVQKYVDQALQNADTTDKQAYIRSKMNAYMNGKAPQAGAPGAQPGQPSQPGMVQTPPSTGFPDMPGSGGQPWSYAERQMFNSAVRPNAQVVDTSMRTQSDQAIKRMEGENKYQQLQLQGENALKVAKQRGADAKELAQINGQIKDGLAQINGEYGLGKAQIMGDARVKAAKASGAGRVNNALTPDQKAGLQQVKSIDDQIKGLQNQLANPFKGLDNMTLTDDQKAAHIQGLQSQLQGLQQQKQTLLDGYKLGPHYQPPGSSQGSPASPGQGSSPNVPGPGPVPSFKQPGASGGIRIQTDPTKAQVGDHLPGPDGKLYPVTKIDAQGPHVDTSRAIPMPQAQPPQSAPAQGVPAMLAAPQGAPAPAAAPPFQLNLGAPTGGMPLNPNAIPGQ